MKRTIVTLAALAALGFAGAAHAAADTGVNYPPLNGGHSESLPPSHFKFQDTGARGVDPTKGIQYSNVWGDATKTAHGAFFRFDPGFVSKLHSHTYDYYAVVIKGSMQNYKLGEKPESLGPGSYWYQRGKEAHTTACVSKEGCEIYIVQAAKFDAQIPPVTD